MDFECSTVGPTLLGLIGIWQKRLGIWTRWWNTQIKVNPSQVHENMGSDTLDKPVAEILAQAGAVLEVVAGEVVVAEGVVFASRPLVATVLADLVGLHLFRVKQDPLALTRHPALWQRAINLADIRFADIFSLKHESSIFRSVMYVVSP